jgi:hypothetical protein
MRVVAKVRRRAILHGRDHEGLLADWRNERGLRCLKDAVVHLEWS